MNAMVACLTKIEHLGAAVVEGYAAFPSRQSEGRCTQRRRDADVVEYRRGGSPQVAEFGTIAIRCQHQRLCVNGASVCRDSDALAFFDMHNRCLFKNLHAHRFRSRFEQSYQLTRMDLATAWIKERAFIGACSQRFNDSLFFPKLAGKAGRSRFLYIV